MQLKEPHKKRVYIEDEHLKQVGMDHFEYMGKPFSGYVIYDYFKPEDNALIDVEFEIEYRNGDKKGWQREYYPNGNVKYESLDFFDTPLLGIYYNEQGVETSRYMQVSQTRFDDMIKKYNMLDKQ